MAFCGNCGTSLSGPFCMNCGTPSGASPTVAQPATPPQEQCFFDEAGIFVSNSRFITPSQTYAMSGVTSVGATITTASKKGPLILIGFGALAVMGAFLGGGPKDFPAVIAVLLCISMIALGIFWFTKRVPTYAVVLRSASGETEATSSKNKDLILRIIAGVNQSIVHRG